MIRSLWELDKNVPLVEEQPGANMAGKLLDRNQGKASGNAYDPGIREAALRVY
jgi:hypothetical protein